MSTILVRFTAKTRLEGICLVWTAARSPAGYGQFRHRGQMRPAHRVAYELSHGEIPAGMSVMHRCDNRACVRLDHLHLGTHAENMQDMATKGRRIGKASGEEHGRAKLTIDQVRVIRASPLGRRTLAALYGVGATTIQHIRQGRNWRHA